jgi:hypothetical protein
MNKRELVDWLFYIMAAIALVLAFMPLNNRATGVPEDANIDYHNQRAGAQGE